MTYPTWFTPQYNPYSFINEPQPTLTVSNVINSVEIFEGREIQFETGKRYYFECEVGYEGDRTFFLREFIEETKKNPLYQKELKEYEESKKRQKEWKTLKAKWDAEQKMTQEQKERLQYEELKKKFEP